MIKVSPLLYAWNYKLSLLSMIPNFHPTHTHENFMWKKKKKKTLCVPEINELLFPITLIQNGLDIQLEMH